jgi:hypothetical protein
MCSPTVAERIHETVPDAKLIAILRNPVDRAYSHYWNIVATYDGMMSKSYAEKLELLPFDEALDTHPKLIEYGMYEKHLRPYAELFGWDQILVLIYEEVTKRPNRHFSEVFRFLNIDDSFQPPLSEYRINSTGQHHGRSHILLRLYSFFTAYVRIPLIPRWIEQANEVSYPPMDEETSAQLEARFREPNRALEELIGRSLDVWH